MRREIVLIGILLLAGISNIALRSVQDRAVENNPLQQSFDIPPVIGSFRQLGPDLELDDRTRQILTGSTVLMRQYMSSTNWPVTLTIVHTGHSRDNLHQPEVCLVGQGWEVSKRYTEPVGFLFEAKRLVLDRGGRQQAVLYWYKTGDRFTDSAWMNALYWAEQQILTGVPTSSIIKLSTPIGRNGEDRAYEILTQMAVRLEPILSENIR